MISNFLEHASISSGSINMLSKLAPIAIGFAPIAIPLLNKKNNVHRAYLHLSDLWFYKEKWKRFYDGINITEYIPHFSYSNLTKEEKIYFDNCKKTQNLGKVYFDTIGNETILVLNMGSPMPYKLIEHNCNIIEFENRGNDDITSFTINYLEITTLDGKKNYLYGGDNNCYTNIISKGEKFNVAIDEVIDELSCSSCKISKEKYDELVDVDVLKDSKAEPLFCLASVKANITLENTYGKKFNYKLTLKMKNNNLIPNMKYNNFIQRLLQKIILKMKQFIQS